MSRWLIGLAVVMSVGLGLRASIADSQNPGPGGIVTTTTTMTAEAAWERKVFAGRDAVKITMTETCRFEIVDWSDDGVTINRQYCDTTVMAEGKGATDYPPPATNVSWTYFAEKPTAPLTDLTLNPGTGDGQVTVGGPRIRTRAADGAEGEGNVAAIALGALITFAELGKAPEGVQFSGPALHSVRQFKFPSKAKQFGGGNQGAWSMSWTEGDGATAKATAHLSYSVSWGQGDPPGDLVFRPEAAYQAWLPAPVPTRAEGVRFEPEGRPLRVTVAIKPAKPGQSPKKARIDFSLADVSRHSGICDNFPPMAKAKDDLRFAAEQPDGIVVDGPGAAHTEEEVSEAVIVVEALDAAAWGKLVARASSLGLVAKFEPGGTYYLTVPGDRNENHIADAWEGVDIDLDPGGDDEAVPGQDVNGDGITVEDEYRGVVVLDGGLRHRRLSPRVKEMVVIDPSADFPAEIWKRLAHVQAYRINDSLADQASNPEGSPLVNSNADTDTHPFYALRIRRIDGDVDPDPARAGDVVQPTTTVDPGFPLMAYAFSPPGIKDTEYIKVFPDRVRMFVDGKIAWLDAGLNDPASDAGRQLRDPQNQFSTQEAAQALAVLRTPAGRALVQRKIGQMLFLHEVGHVCGLPDHQGAAPGDEVRSCLMFNPGQYGQRRMVVLTALGRGDADLSFPTRAICRMLGCAARVNVKDW